MAIQTLEDTYIQAKNGQWYHRHPRKGFIEVSSNDWKLHLYQLAALAKRYGKTTYMYAGYPRSTNMYHLFTAR